MEREGGRERERDGREKEMEGERARRTNVRRERHG